MIASAPRSSSSPAILRQQGSTLTGVIIGLIVGLVIAVVVALAINKGSMPFTDKAGKMSKMAEPTEGQASDPNKPLYGNKAAAREANRQLADKPKAPEADPLAAVIAGFKTDAAHEAKPESKPDAKPASKPEAKPAPAAVPAEAARPALEDKVVYYLQAGAFREVSDAENTRAKLALLGFEAAISERSSDSGVLHRVRIGPYNQAETMNRARAKLLDNGIDVAIVRNQKSTPN